MAASTCPLSASMPCSAGIYPALRVGSPDAAFLAVIERARPASAHYVGRVYQVDNPAYVVPLEEFDASFFGPRLQMV